jgi:hypothetical protein
MNPTLVEFKLIAKNIYRLSAKRLWIGHVVAMNYEQGS